MSVEKRMTKGGPRYEVRFRAPDGKERSRSFRTRKEADRYEAAQRTDLGRGVWADPRSGRTTLSEYAPRWLETAYVGKTIRPTTYDTYEGLWRLHISPVLGSLKMGAITPQAVREWHAGVTAKSGANLAAKAYRLLRTILATAVEDGLIVSNPCSLKKAGVERAPERPVATVGQVYALADAMPPERSCLVLLAAFCGLRIGELLALTRRDVDLLHRTVTVRRQLQRSKKAGGAYLAEPKTDAGRRTVSIPPPLLEKLEQHLSLYAAPGEDGYIFPSSTGGPAHKPNVGVQFRRAVKAMGLVGFHFHDLRHTGNTLAAATGASTKELMARLGHASSRAALIYQHATEDRDQALALALGRLIEEGVKETGRTSLTPLPRSSAG